MALQIHVDPPDGQSYRLPAATDRDQLRAELSRLGEKRCIVVEFEMRDDPRVNGMLYINAETVISVLLTEVADDVLSEVAEAASDS